MDVCLLLIPVKWMEESVHKVRVRYLVGETKQSLEKSPNVSFAFFGHLEKILVKYKILQLIINVTSLTSLLPIVSPFGSEENLERG